MNMNLDMSSLLPPFMTESMSLEYPHPDSSCPHPDSSCPHSETL